MHWPTLIPGDNGELVGLFGLIVERADDADVTGAVVDLEVSWVVEAPVQGY